MFITKESQMKTVLFFQVLCSVSGFGLSGILLRRCNRYSADKKTRGKSLIGEQKAENRKISSVRVLVEHVLGSMKRCKTV
jgi:hypothetical protein